MAFFSPLSPSTKAVGFWSAVSATVLSLIYSIAQIAEWVGLLGSAGGPESASTPLGLIVLLTPSLLLGPAFLMLMVAVHQGTAPARRVWSLSAVAFATIYTTLVCVNYYVQLAWVTPRLKEGRTEGLEPFLFVPFDSFLYAVDILGYGFMSVAAFCAARVFNGKGRERVARLLLTATGCVLPFLLLQMFVPALIWPAAIWALVFPGATGTVAILFRRADVGVE